MDRYSQDECLFHQMPEAMERGKRDMLILTGMGGSYCAFYPACIYLNEHGLLATMLEASELLHYHKGLISERVLLVMASQSGETIEVKSILEEVRDCVCTVGITNEAESYLAKNCDIPLLIYAGEEVGPASKTYTSTLAVLLILAISLTSDSSRMGMRELYAAAEAMDNFLKAWEERINGLVDFLGGVDCIFLLGRGPSMASAMAGALGLKEAAKIRAEGMSAGQFRHGPLEVVGPGFAAIVFAAEGRTKDLNLRLAQDIAKFGGKVVLIGSDGTSKAERILHLSLPRLDEFSSPILEILPLQLLAWRMAKEKGLQPGRLDKAKKVTLYE